MKVSPIVIAAAAFALVLFVLSAATGEAAPNAGRTFALVVAATVIVAAGWLGVLWLLRRRQDATVFKGMRESLEEIASAREASNPRPASKGNPFRLSAFAPEQASPGDRVLLQAYFHFARHLDRVVTLAQERDREARRRGATPLAVRPEQGDRIRVTLSANGLEIDEAEQTLFWMGGPVSADFELKLPEMTSADGYTLTLRAEVNGIPVGSLKLRLAVAAKPTEEGARQPGEVRRAAASPTPRGAFHAYEYIFLSYASDDRRRVLDVAQVLDRLGIAFFQDVLTLRAGEHWEERISSELQRADALILFWSKSAAQSQWVAREAEMALGLQKSSRDGTPHILSVILEQPPPLPPPSLAAIHFNDPISCVWTASAR